MSYVVFFIFSRHVRIHYWNQFTMSNKNNCGSTCYSHFTPVTEWRFWGKTRAASVNQNLLWTSRNVRNTLTNSLCNTINRLSISARDDNGPYVIGYPIQPIIQFRFKTGACKTTFTYPEIFKRIHSGSNKSIHLLQNKKHLINHVNHHISCMLIIT